MELCRIINVSNLCYAAASPVPQVGSNVSLAALLL